MRHPSFAQWRRRRPTSSSIWTRQHRGGGQRHKSTRVMVGDVAAAFRLLCLSSLSPTHAPRQGAQAHVCRHMRSCALRCESTFASGNAARVGGHGGLNMTDDISSCFCVLPLLPSSARHCWLQEASSARQAKRVPSNNLRDFQISEICRARRTSESLANVVNIHSIVLAH